MARPAAGRQIATLAAPPLQMDLAAASGALLALLLSVGLILRVSGGGQLRPGGEHCLLRPEGVTRALSPELSPKATSSLNSILVLRPAPEWLDLDP